MYCTAKMTGTSDMDRIGRNKKRGRKKCSERDRNRNMDVEMAGDIDRYEDNACGRVRNRTLTLTGTKLDSSSK